MLNKYEQIEIEQRDNFQFITQYDLKCEESFPMLDFYFARKDDFSGIVSSYQIEFHKEHGLPPIPSWFKNGMSVTIKLFRYKMDSDPDELRKFAESIGCVCGGDFGLALLWITAEGKVPKWDFIFSPYENMEVDMRSCQAFIRYRDMMAEGWVFDYDSKPLIDSKRMEGENYFICFSID